MLRPALIILFCIPLLCGCGQKEAEYTFQEDFLPYKISSLHPIQCTVERWTSAGFSPQNEPASSFRKFIRVARETRPVLFRIVLHDDTAEVTVAPNLADGIGSTSYKVVHNADGILLLQWTANWSTQTILVDLEHGTFLYSVTRKPETWVNGIESETAEGRCLNA
jgi:hypothetical protein